MFSSFPSSLVSLFFILWEVPQPKATVVLKIPKQTTVDKWNGDIGFCDYFSRNL